jgi:hypothetical protein
MSDIEQAKKDIREILSSIAQEKFSKSSFSDDMSLIRASLAALEKVTNSIMADPELATPDIAEPFAELLKTQSHPGIREKALEGLLHIVQKYEDTAETLLPVFEQILADKEESEEPVNKMTEIRERQEEDANRTTAVTALWICGNMYEQHRNRVVKTLSEGVVGNTTYPRASEEAVRGLGAIGCNNRETADAVVKIITNFLHEMNELEDDRTEDEKNQSIYASWGSEIAHNPKFRATPQMILSKSISAAQNALESIALDNEVQATAIVCLTADSLKKDADPCDYISTKALAAIGEKYDTQKDAIITIMLKQLENWEERDNTYHVEKEALKKALSSLGYKAPEPEKTPEDLEKERQIREELQEMMARKEEERRQKEAEDRCKEEARQQKQERAQSITDKAERLFNGTTERLTPQQEEGTEEESAPVTEGEAAPEPAGP